MLGNLPKVTHPASNIIGTRILLRFVFNSKPLTPTSIIIQRVREVAQDPTATQSLGPCASFSTALLTTAAVQGLISLLRVAFPYLAVEDKATTWHPRLLWRSD